MNRSKDHVLKTCFWTPILAAPKGGVPLVKRPFKLFIICAATALSLLVLGCGPSKSFKPQAPKRKTLGVAVTDISQNQVQQILQLSTQTRVREIYRRHGMYEFFGVSLEEVQKITGPTKAHQNQFVALKKVKTKTPNSGSPAGKIFASCKDRPYAPTAKLKVLNPNAEDYTIDLGDRLRLSADGSQPHPQQASKLDFFWIIQVPDGSRLPQSVITGPQLDFEPDTMGEFFITLIVRDNKSSCAGEEFSLIVTSNPKFKGITYTSAEIESLLPVNDFHHLKYLSAKQAWKLSQGENTLIAIIDSGVNYNGLGLANNISISKGEVPGDGKDNDANGFVDDYIGYDFVNKDAFPFDDSGHGSQVAGLAASSSFGLARRAKILPIKALDSDGGDVATISAAIIYAVDQKADIINLSFAGPEIYNYMVHALNYAEKNNVLVVAAAGNGDPSVGLGIDIDYVPFFPASFPHTNILSVAASGKPNALALYSNFGLNAVDVVAPGGTTKRPLKSLYMENSAGLLTLEQDGTSMAAPIVAGIAAQVKSLAPQLDASELKQLLMAAGDPVDQYVLRVRSGRQLDSLSAVNLALEKTLP